jgi:hypothetical protein
MIGVVNSIVGGAGVALLLGTAAGLPIAVAAPCGAAFAIAVAVAGVRYERRAFRAALARTEVRFPSPP